MNYRLLSVIDFEEGINKMFNIEWLERWKNLRSFFKMKSRYEKKLFDRYIIYEIIVEVIKRILNDINI